MHFQLKGPNTAVTRPVDQLWQLRAQTTCLGSGYKHKLQNAVTPNFAAKTKMGINAFSMGMWLAKCLTHNISTTMRSCEIERWFQRTTYRKLHIASPTVTWPMTSRDHERSRSWPQYHMKLRKVKVMTPISLKLNIWKTCEIDGRFKLTTYRKSHIAYSVVTWQMTSREPQKSGS